MTNNKTNPTDMREAFSAVITRGKEQVSYLRKVAENNIKTSQEIDDSLPWDSETYRALSMSQTGCADELEHYILEGESTLKALNHKPAIPTALEIASEILIRFHNNLSGEKPKIEEWQACYAFLFKQLNEIPACKPAIVYDEAIIEKIALNVQKNFPVVNTGTDERGDWCTRPLELKLFKNLVHDIIKALTGKESGDE